jgi:hypothetical protein
MKLRPAEPAITQALALLASAGIEPLDLLAYSLAVNGQHLADLIKVDAITDDSITPTDQDAHDIAHDLSREAGHELWDKTRAWFEA